MYAVKFLRDTVGILSKLSFMIRIQIDKFMKSTFCINVLDHTVPMSVEWKCRCRHEFNSYN